MKVIFLCLITILLNGRSNEMLCYKQALPLILNSVEFNEYGLRKENYNVSSEVISFSIFSQFFATELKNDVIVNIDLPEVGKVENELLVLNVKKKGKIKIFFSEIKEDMFFAEVFIYNNHNFKYEKRPIFGSSNVYLFKIDNKITSLVKVQRINYN